MARGASGSGLDICTSPAIGARRGSGFDVFAACGGLGDGEAVVAESVEVEADEEKWEVGTRKSEVVGMRNAEWGVGRAKGRAGR